MNCWKRLFCGKKEREERPLCIDGMAPAPLTAEPDDAELAAQALLEQMAGVLDDNAEKSGRKKQREPAKGSVEYYNQLAEKIRKVQESARIRATRFITFCEHELKKSDLPVTGEGSLSLLETELYKRMDTIEREGGELKRRWQRCLADVTVRLMQAQDT